VYEVQMERAERKEGYPLLSLLLSLLCVSFSVSLSLSLSVFISYALFNMSDDSSSSSLPYEKINVLSSRISPCSFSPLRSPVDTATVSALSTPPTVACTAFVPK